MTGIREYLVGKRHGQTGIRHMAHRKRPYNGRSHQLSYNHGYIEGNKERLATGKGGLDYDNKLNNQDFSEHKTS